MPAWMAPSMVRAPVVMTATTKTSEILVAEEIGRSPGCRTEPYRAPPNPAMPADMAKTVSRAVRRLMPMLAAAVGLPRMAARYRPTVPRWTRSTSTQHSTRATKHEDQERPVRAEVDRADHGTGHVDTGEPPPDHEYWNSDWSAKRAKARVTSASSRPDTRMATRATTSRRRRPAGPRPPRRAGRAGRGARRTARRRRRRCRRRWPGTATAGRSCR